MNEEAIAAATRIIDAPGLNSADAQLVAGMFLHTLAQLAKLEGILVSVGLSDSQAVQIIARMNAE